MLKMFNCNKLIIKFYDNTCENNAIEFNGELLIYYIVIYLNLSFSSFLKATHALFAIFSGINIYKLNTIQTCMKHMEL